MIFGKDFVQPVAWGINVEMGITGYEIKPGFFSWPVTEEPLNPLASSKNLVQHNVYRFFDTFPMNLRISTDVVVFHLFVSRYRSFLIKGK